MPRFKRLRSDVSSVPFFFNENVSNASIDDLENQKSDILYILHTFFRLVRGRCKGGKS